MGWRTFFGKFGYGFVTTESNGVNAFFVDPAAFDVDFVENLQGIRSTRELLSADKYRTIWEAQF